MVATDSALKMPQRSLNSKVTLILAEASIEKVPEKLWNHPSVKSDSRRRRRHPSKILLYLPIHFRALADAGIPTEKRARPDIAHRALIAALDSTLNKDGHLDVYVHTIEDKVIWINPSTRIPLDYYRFEGLMVQLLEKGRVPPTGNTTFLKLLDKSIEDIVKESGKKVYLLSREGNMLTPEIARRMLGNIVIVGAFQEGGFSERMYKLSHEVVSISKYDHLASTVVCWLLNYINYIRLSG